MNEMRKLMEAVEQLTEYGSEGPVNWSYKELEDMHPPQEDGSGNYNDWLMELMGEYSSVDWKTEPEEVLKVVAEYIEQYGLRVEILGMGDDQSHFKITNK